MNAKNETLPEDLFANLRNIQIRSAAALFDISRVAVISLVLIVFSNALLFVSPFIDRWLQIALSVSILSASVVAICWAWFVFPGSADELFEEEGAASAKQEGWRL